MRVDNWKNKLVGFGSDGASVKMVAGGLRGYLEADIPFVVVFWCLAHRLELSLKDALKHTFSSKIDEMLSIIRELVEIAADLKLCLEESELPNKGKGATSHSKHVELNLFHTKLVHLEDL